MKIYIYKLIDPETREVRYIGKTINLKKRLYQHLYSINSSKTYCSNWIKSLNKKDLIPIMAVIEECDESNWEEKEIYWIKQYTNLTNHTIGGEGCTYSMGNKKAISNYFGGDIELIIHKAIELTGTMSDVQIEKQLGLSKGFLCRARTGRIKYINKLDVIIPKSQNPTGNGGATKGMKLKLTKPRRKEKTLTYMKDRNKWRIYHYVNNKRKIFGMYNTKKEALKNI